MTEPAASAQQNNADGTAHAAAASTDGTGLTDPRARILTTAALPSTGVLATNICAVLATRGYPEEVSKTFAKSFDVITDGLQQVISWNDRISRTETSDRPPKSCRVNFQLVPTSTLADTEKEFVADLLSKATTAKEAYEQQTKELIIELHHRRRNRNMGATG
mmetsp:Transcript_5360/g.15183  ORF Transcript_5360/g.15183 Transcript_5360/m.15183 type:complete len:162 (-) Transcript_5360:183-668(-)